MTTEQFEQKQAAMSNEELIELASNQVSELAKTGGRSHRMCVPPMITDTDMVLCELVKRFKNIISNPICNHCGKYRKMPDGFTLRQLCECGS